VPTTRQIELAGQSIMFRFMGPVFTPEDKDAFHRIRPAGVLFFGDNLDSRDQIRALTDELQATARAEGMPPLFIAADQEGGIVTRLPADMVTIPSAMALGALNPADIREMARVTARQLLEVGINLNFAPTVDVNINPQNPVIRTRSFGETPEIVARGGVAAINGHLDEGVIPTIKHFPGHGDTNIDSHHGLPVIDQPLERLHRVELVPFKAGIEAGVPAIMTAHIVFPVLDEHPATLSRRILTGLLRQEMGFDGLIVTDSMSMDAISTRYGLADAAIRTKAAGSDLVESSEPAQAMVERHAVFAKAIEDGTLDIELFEATERRLNLLRERFRIGEAPEFLATDETLRLKAREVARRALRTISGAAVPELDDDPSTVIIAFARLRALEVVDRFDLPGVMAEALSRKRPSVRMITLSPELTGEEVDAALAAVSEANTLVVMTRDAINHPDQVELGNRLFDTADSAKKVHVCLRGPYDRGMLGDVDETVMTYGDPVVSLQALADAFAGA
jgi:beta-N-acetylhexosaminidase